MRSWLIGLVLLAGCGGRDPVPGASADSTGTLPGMNAAPPSTDSARADSTVKGSAPSAPTSAPGTAQAPLRGKIVASGSENMNLTTLQMSSGPMVVLTGSLEQELRSLASATVAVNGPETMQGNRRIVDVKSYEVLDINGERPLVGTLSGSSQLVVGADTIAIVGDVKAPAGSKVWITGDRSGKQLKVRSYGVIR